MWEACLNPDYLAEMLSSVLFEKTRHTSGHIHFHFRNKSDHIVLIWSEGKLKKIVAKSPGCKKGQYKHWKDSQFCDFDSEYVLRELYDEIERIKIDDGSFYENWSSYAKFISWLTEN